MKNTMKVFNSFRLGAFILILVFVGWNEYSSSISDKQQEKSQPELGFTRENNTNSVNIDSLHLRFNEREME